MLIKLSTWPSESASIEADSPAPIERGLGFVVSDITRLMRIAFAERAATRGLTLAKARALVRLEQHEGVRQVELADLLEIQPITLARLVDVLEGQDLIERRRDDRDRRAYRLYLTPAARPVLAEIHEIADEISRQAFVGLEHGDAVLVRRALDRMRANLCS